MADDVVDEFREPVSEQADRLGGRVGVENLPLPECSPFDDGQGHVSGVGRLEAVEDDCVAEPL